MVLITFLQEWYKSVSKSSIYTGIQIGTSDNSGWYVHIDLFDTDFETKNFKSIDIYKDEKNWVRCIKENDIFKGYGGIQNLEDILNVFYKWVTNI